MLPEGAVQVSHLHSCQDFVLEFDSMKHHLSCACLWYLDLFVPQWLTLHLPAAPCLVQSTTTVVIKDAEKVIFLQYNVRFFFIVIRLVPVYAYLRKKAHVAFIISVWHLVQCKLWSFFPTPLTTAILFLMLCFN